MSESNDSVDVSPQNGDYIEEETGDESSSNGPVAGPEISMNQEPGQEEEEVNHVENKEDMFVDAADDIEDTHSQEMDNFNDGETDNEVTQDIDKDAGFKDYKEQREECAKEVANVLRQLKNLTNNEDSVELVGGASLSEMLIECSQHVKVSLEQKLQSENTIRELQRQIEELNVKAQVEQNVNISADSMLGALSMVVNQEELSDYSVVGKVAHVEKTTSLLVEQYRWFLYEVDQLRQCLLEGGFNVGPQEDFGYGSVFAVARGELLQLKKTEAELSGKVNYLEGVNRELVEEVEKEKTSAELANSELEKVKVELEQEKNRYVSAKEKLGMAVTKGKALVQQRDSLKLSLAEKTSQLEKCLVELQEKSNAAEAAELCRVELSKCENLVASLQENLAQRNAVLEICEEVLTQARAPDEVQESDLIEKLKWLVNQVASLQETIMQNNAIFLTFEEIFSRINVSEETESINMIERLKGLVNLVSSLQEMISQRNKILISLEEIVSEVDMPAEFQSMDAVQRLKWIVEERDALKSNLLEFHRLKDALSSIDLPESATSSNMETGICWLKDTVKQAKDEIKMLQDEIVGTKGAAQKDIDRLSFTLLVVLQEKEYVKMELDELASKYEGVSQEAHKASSEKDQIVRLLLESSGIEDTYSDEAVLIKRCFEKIKERSSTSFDTSPADAELLESMQRLLFVRDQELMLHERLLEEDLLVRSEVSNLSNDLRVASTELAALKEEKDSLQKSLERSEEKSVLLKEKLSLAVKKGKGLFQDRENLKLTLDDKNSEIEKLKLELQNQAYALTECRDQISRLSADLEQVPRLETDLISMKNKHDQIEQFLVESNNMLQRVIEAVDSIVLPVDLDFKEPAEKLSWLAGYMNECQKAKSHAEQELVRVEKEINIMTGKLAEAQESIKSLEATLSVAENHISQLTEEKLEIEVAKKNVEQDLQKSKEEAHAQTSNFKEACVTRKSLEDALSEAESHISFVVKEREEAQLSKAAKETELEKVREEVTVHTEELKEAYTTIKYLKDALSQTEANVSLLSEQNTQFQVEKTDLENELKKLKEEVESYSSRMENATRTMQLFEKAQLSRASMETELQKMRGEVAVQTEKLTEAYKSIKFLEDALSQAEANVSLLSEQNTQFQVEKTDLENELKKLKEEVESYASRMENATRTMQLFEKAQLSRASMETELQKMRGEVAVQTEKLTEAYKSIKFLEDALSQAEANVSLLSEQNTQFQVEKTDSENELKKLKEEVESYSSRMENATRTMQLFEKAQLSRASMETELQKMRGEVAVQTEKLTEAYKSIEFLEDALSQAEANVSLLSEQNTQFQVEKTDSENELKKLKEEVESYSSRMENATRTMQLFEKAQLSRASMETELQKMRGEVAVQTEKLTEAYKSIEFLEDALSQAEANVSLLSEQNSNFQVGITDLENEPRKLKEEAADTTITKNQLQNAQLSRAAMETELEKLREDVAVQTEKLNESYRTIKSLEDTISLAETNASLLSDQNNHFQAGRTTLANELEKLKEEASSHASSFANTSATIKSLEDALLKAGNDISVLEGEKRIAEQEICTLNSRLKTCMDELAGMHTSIENRSEELIHHLSDLQRLMRSKSMLSMVRPHFDQEFENLKIMDRILREIKDHFVHKGSEVLPSHLAMEEDLYVEKPFPSDLGNTVNAEMDDVSLNSADGDNISELLKKAIEEFQLHSSNFSGNFECFSSCIVEFIEALLVRLRLTKDAVTNIFEHMESMKQSMKNMEINIEEKDKKIIMLEKDCRVLLSACTKATGKLQFEVKNNLLDLGCTPELEKLNHSTIPAEVTEVDVDGVEHDSTYDNTVENLLLATTKVCAQTKLFESTSNVAASTIEELQKQLSENRAVYENALDEKSIIQDRVTALETEVKALQNSCQELKYEATEKLKEKEAELLQQNFSMKAQEADMLMAPSELRILFDKIRMVEIPCIDSEVGDVESPDSAVLQKLYYIIDSVPKLHNQINTLSHEKDKLQSTLSMQDLEIERLKKESEMLIRYRQESESMRAEMSEITSSLEKIIETLGGSEIVGYKKSVDVQRLLPLVEKHIVALILEAKSSKSQADELGSRLLVSQKVIDELSTKIKVLEDSFESKTVPPEVVQERSIFEAASLPTSSEISESEDVVSVGKNSISPVASAAQLRTMRKGSTDHLVLNVDPESASLINNGETDEDKGHVFKSLNTSGLIPRQGKSLADRLDGIWVSGGRVLMSRPRARLGLIAYCLLLHLWLLGTIL